MNRVPKVKRGDHISFRAGHWNAFADAANAHMDASIAQGRGAPPADLPTTILVPVKITTNLTQRWAIRYITGVVFDPGDDEDAFKRTPWFFTTTSQSTGEPFVVLHEPCRWNQIVRAVVMGVTPVKFDHRHQDHQYVEAVSGPTYTVRSASAGWGRILWKETELGGDKWAVILLGVGPSRPSDPDEYESLMVRGTGDNVREVWDYVRLHGNPV